MNNNSNYHMNLSWLHISDLHVFPEADTTLILEDYMKLAKIISPQFIVATGDFRHLKYKTNFSLAKDYLESIINIFNIDKKDTFLVPGNHDTNIYSGRIKAIKDICAQSNNNYNIYSKYINDKQTLYDGFLEYDSFVRDFYKDSGVVDARIINPSKVYCILWNHSINILSLNTALISDGSRHEQIIDINELSNCYIDTNYPTIMLGHHSIESLYASQYSRLESIIDRRNISVYMHGDIHKYSNSPIRKISTPNRTIPSIACGKSAPQSGDMYSDIGVIYYYTCNDSNTYIQAYKWSPKGFVEDPVYFYEINKIFSFPMIYTPPQKSSDLVDKITFLAHNHPNIFMAGEWVEEAESFWNTNRNEVLGRSLLLFYYTKAKNGMEDKRLKAQKIYQDLSLIHTNEAKTQLLLQETKKLLFSSNT